MVSCPLLTPLTFLLHATPFGCASKKTKESTDLNLCSPFSYAIDVCFRDLPRITVRGQPAQSVRLALRTAPLRSSMKPWSTKHICGPLAFRREAPLSVQRKVWGVKRGKETIWCPCPFCLRRETPAFPGRRRRPLSALTSSVNLASSGAPLYRRNVYPQQRVNPYRSRGSRGTRRRCTPYRVRPSRGSQ